MTDTCLTCLYFLYLTPALAGLCRAHPPATDTGKNQLWPAVKPVDWCGEWKKIG